MAKSGNPWMTHLAAFWKNNKSKGMSYRKAMKEAKKSYTKKRSRGGGKLGALSYSEVATTPSITPTKGGRRRTRKRGSRKRRSRRR